MTETQPLVGVPGNGQGMAGGRLGLEQVRAALASTADLLRALPQSSGMPPARTWV